MALIRELIRFTQWEVRGPVRFFLKRKKKKSLKAIIASLIAIISFKYYMIRSSHKFRLVFLLN